MTGANKMFMDMEHGSVSEDRAPWVLKIGDLMIITHTKSQERRHMPITLGQGKWRQDVSRISTARAV